MRSNKYAIALFLFIFGIMMAIHSNLIAADCDVKVKKRMKSEKLTKILECLKDEIEKIKKEKNSSDLPVGTIISSMVPPKKFFKKYSEKKWRTANGDTIPSFFEYVAITGNKKLPDLRGMFLRGLNLDRNDGNQDPEGNKRTPGSYQRDELKNHIHGLNWWASGGMKLPNRYPGINNSYNPKPNQGSINGVTPYGGAETRPKNVSIYWYIKIN
ncbi:tail fiber protein [Candidatus Magnetomorum sp. HK-1]|nr:tail fiber protein [Candidatus Magnetomorum sp. HK-1]